MSNINNTLVTGSVLQKHCSHKRILDFKWLEQFEYFLYSYVFLGQSLIIVVAFGIKVGLSNIKIELVLLIVLIHFFRNRSITDTYNTVEFDGLILSFNMSQRDSYQVSLYIFRNSEVKCL